MFAPGYRQQRHETLGWMQQLQAYTMTATESDPPRFAFRSEDVIKQLFHITSSGSRPKQNLM